MDGNGGSRRILDALLQLVDARHEQFNGTLYQLEPDIKSAPGGLRDIAAARHLRILQPSAFTAEAGDDRSVRLLQDAEDFLLRIRSVLHLETNRDVNILSHDLQEKVAEAFSPEGRQLQQRVEALMSQYFRHARSSER
jgi:[protein-PII] uridylyltransferase